VVTEAIVPTGGLAPGAWISEFERAPGGFSDRRGPQDRTYRRELVAQRVHGLALRLDRGAGRRSETEAGRRGWTRTSDPLLRRQVLYPPELRAR
jgi:hypothetical protein